MGAVLTSDERALFERWSVFARELSGDHALLDRQTRCAAVFGRELLKVGDSLAEHAADPLIYPLKDACNVRVMFRGECWCAHVQPIRNEAGDAALYLCSFTDTQQALDAAAKTDALMKLMPLYSAIEQNFAGLWNSAREIEKRFERAFQPLFLFYRLKRFVKMFYFYYSHTLSSHEPALSYCPNPALKKRQESANSTAPSPSVINAMPNGSVIIESLPINSAAG